MSLTELIVTMFIMSVVIIGAVSLTIGFQRTNAANLARQDAIDTARTTSESMSRTIRAAVKPSQLTLSCAGCTQDAFIEARDFSVRFYSNINNAGNTVGPSRVTYGVALTGANAGVLTESVQRPDSNTPTATGYQYCDAAASSATAACKARLSTRTVARGVVTNAGALLRYYDQDGTRMTPPTNGTLSAAELEKVLSIELVVQVTSLNVTSADPTVYIQRIMLPNAQAVLRQGEVNP